MSGNYTSPSIVLNGNFEFNSHFARFRRKSKRNCLAKEKKITKSLCPLKSGKGYIRCNINRENEISDDSRVDVPAWPKYVAAKRNRISNSNDGKRTRWNTPWYDILLASVVSVAVLKYRCFGIPGSFFTSARTDASSRKVGLFFEEEPRMPSGFFKNVMRLDTLEQTSNSVQEDICVYLNIFIYVF